jgi:integrase
VEAIKDLMKKAVKSRNQLEFENLESELSALLEFKQPTERRYRVNDATVEKLVELLKDNPRGLLMYRDELFGWLRNLDKIGREGDRTFFLESWNGNGDYTQDRIGRGTIRVKGVCISIFGTIQPGRLNSYIHYTNFLRRVWHKVQDQAQVRRRTPHDLRHSWASHMLASGADLAYVSNQLGHANPSITLRIYSHWVPGTRRITTSILDTKSANKQQMLEKNGGEEKEEMTLSY